MADPYDDEYDSFDDDLEDQLSNCYMFEEAGHWFCPAVGSEDCDWRCPFSSDIGKPVEHSPTPQQEGADVQDS